MASTFVLIHGAGSGSWYWHLIVPELQAHGHDVEAVDLPADDDSAGLAEYADTVVQAVGNRTDLVAVAQSMAGLTAPLVCERLPVKLMVLVAARAPGAGRGGGERHPPRTQPVRRHRPASQPARTNHPPPSYVGSSSEVRGPCSSGVEAPDRVMASRSGRNREVRRVTRLRPVANSMPIDDLGERNRLPFVGGAGRVLELRLGRSVDLALCLSIAYEPMREPCDVPRIELSQREPLRRLPNIDLPFTDDAVPNPGFHRIPVVRDGQAHRKGDFTAVGIRNGREHQLWIGGQPPARASVNGRAAQCLPRR